MSATYDPTLDTPLDRVRFRLGDTVVVPESAAQLSNEEITALLTQADGNEGRAALAAAKSLYARYSRMVSTSVGDTSIQMGELADNFRSLIHDLEEELMASGVIGTPYAGGISRADKAAREADADRVAPAFSREGVGSAGRFRLNRFGDWS